MHLSNNNKTGAQEHLATDYMVITLTKTALTENNWQDKRNLNI